MYILRYRTARQMNFYRYRHRTTLENSLSYKPEVKTVPQTGSTNNLTTETDIDAISVAIPMFWGQVYHWCICQPHLTLPSPINSKMADGYRKYL